MKKRPHKWLGLVLASALLSVSAVSPARLQTTVEWLSDAMREGRSSRSTGAMETAVYLLDQVTALGLEAQLQDIGPARRNVVARLGTHSRHIVVGAHYDGQGRGYPSASDNAAGVAVLLELARDLSAVELPVSVVFIAFDDEEQGLNGSRYYAENPVYPLDDAVAVVIMDTMGRSFIDLERWTLIVLGTEFSPELRSVVMQHRSSEMALLGTDLVGPRSDFAAFAARQIPYLFFSNATHADYHGPGDTPDRLRYENLDADAETIRQVIVDIGRLDVAPTYAEEPVYPEGEATELIALLDAIETERDALAASYAVLFADLRERLGADQSRENLRLATSVLLAAATPGVSAFSLSSLIGPFYEAEGKTEAAVAAYREALKWTTNPFARSSIEEKIQALDP